MNLRNPHVNDAVILDSLRLANTLKLNDDELPRLTRLAGASGSDHDVMRSLAAQYDLQTGARLPFRIPPPPHGMPKHLRVWYWAIASMVLASLAVVPMCPTQDAVGRPTWRVRTVHDGDTVTCIDATGAPQKIRLVGIDAPEFDQPYGRASRAALEGKIVNRLVRVTGTARDRYGRLLGTLWIDTRNINRELVSEGAAWEFGGFSPDRDLVEQELNAREARRGLWADPEPMSPTQWRNTHRHHVHPQNAGSKEPR